MEHQNNPTGTRQVGVSKKYYCPADLKASKKVTASPSNDAENKVVLPEPPIREVPVNVTRRTGPPVAVLPPPSNRHQNNTKPKSTITRRDRKRQIHGGDGSDSDSDSDETKQTNANDGISDPHKKTPHQIDGVVEESSKAAIEAEELARVQQQRLLRNIGDAWYNSSQYRKRYRRNADVISFRLQSYGFTQHKRPTLYDYPPVPERVIDADELFKEFLDDILYGHVKGTLDTNEHTVLESIITSVEEGVLRRCNQTEETESSETPQYLLLSESLSNLRHEIFSSDEVQSEYRRLRRRYHSFLCQSAVCPLTRGSESGDESLTCCNDPSPSEFLESGDDWMDPIDRQSFWQLVTSCFQGLSRRTIQRRRLSLIDRSIEYLTHVYLDKICGMMFNSMFAALLGASLDDNWLEFIKRSRQNERLAPEYIDWVTPKGDPAMLHDLGVKWRRKEVAAQYKDEMDHQGMKISQEFCQDLVKPGTVSLLLVKNNFPTGIQELSERDLFELGWRRESGNLEYWRCKLTSDRKAVLKVDMNDRVLGLFGFEPGSQNWIFVQDQGPSQEPLTRPICLQEALVMGVPSLP